MPTPTYDLISSTVLGSSTSTVSLSSIPSTYRDLVIVVTAISSVNAQLRARPNGATTNHLSLAAESTGATTASVTFSNLGELSQFNNFGTEYAITIIHFFDYAQTNKHKSVLMRMNRAGQGVAMMGGRWASTTAISSIDIYNDSGTWSAGSTLYLYGIAG
jgi:hypothetical protein